MLGCDRFGPQHARLVVSQQDQVQAWSVKAPTTIDLRQLCS
jgi:hypothetical protein